MMRNETTALLSTRRRNRYQIAPTNRALIRARRLFIFRLDDIPQGTPISSGQFYLFRGRGECISSRREKRDRTRGERRGHHGGRGAGEFVDGRGVTGNMCTSDVLYDETVGAEIVVRTDVTLDACLVGADGLHTTITFVE